MLLTARGMDNDKIAAGLERIAALLALEGADHDQLSAYRHAAAVLRHCVRPARELVEEDGVEGLHSLGIGYLLSGLVTDWIRLGRSQLLETLEQRHAKAMCRVPGIGPGLARTLHANGIDTLKDLDSVAHEGRLADICGFGPRRIELVLGALAAMMPRRSRGPVQFTLGIDTRGH